MLFTPELRVNVSRWKDKTSVPLNRAQEFSDVHLDHSGLQSEMFKDNYEHCSCDTVGEK